MSSREKAGSFSEVMRRATGHSGEPLAANMITQYMRSEDKNACVEAYDVHIEDSNRDERISEQARAACLLMRREDLYRKVYDLLLSPAVTKLR